MKIKKIYLRNIRSYKEQEIEFKTGSTLLSGDIGCGKTSVLLAIEFALFGLQPGQKGASILRNDSSEGGVRMEFEVNGNEVIVERTLKRGKAISQDYSSIEINGEKREVSVTELKTKILELLDYPSEFAKKQNLLYKFTVYTPQEEMKQIILQDPETRINTLRHIFGIDKYKRIIENISIVNSKIREEQKRIEGFILSLEQDKSLLIIKENDLETKQNNLYSIEKELFLKIEIRKKVQEDILSIEDKIQEKRKIEQEIEKTKIILSTKDDSIFNNTKLIGELKNQIKSLENFEFQESKITLLKEDIKKLKSHLVDLRERNIQIRSQISSLEFKNNESETLKKQISHIDICPTCLQDVGLSYKSNVVNKMDSIISENVKIIKDVSQEQQELTKTMSQIEFDISKKEKEVQELEILKIRLQQVQETKKRILDLEKSNISFEKDLELLSSHINSLKASSLSLSKYDNLFNAKKLELDYSLREERLAEIKVAELKREIEVFSRQIDELKEKIAKIEEIKLKLNYLLEIENWLSKSFVALVSFVEKNVMAKLKSNFSDLFNKWFAMLVSDNFNVTLDEDFTPIIEQQDYEIDYAYLSGGERTAIALAYRLALNQVINSFLSKISTKDLVILDEPTDGFSDQQLDKMRDILMQLDVGQLILVSHEQKIESFVENIIRFKKEQGETLVEWEK